MMVPDQLFGRWSEVRARMRLAIREFRGSGKLPRAFFQPTLDMSTVECRVEQNFVRERKLDEICFLDAPLVVLGASRGATSEERLRLALNLLDTTWGGLACLSEEANGLTGEKEFRGKFLRWILEHFDALDEVQGHVQLYRERGLWRIPSTIQVVLGALGAPRDSLVAATDGAKVRALVENYFQRA